MVKHKFKRAITHTEYIANTWNRRKYFTNEKNWVQKMVYQKIDPIRVKDVGKKEIFLEFNNKYGILDTKTSGKITPLVGGGFGLLLIIICLTSSDGFEGGGLFLFIVGCILSVFFTFYFFTIPDKELILNREDGLITVPGWYWQKDITMPFDNMLFTFSKGSTTMVSAFMLKYVRPGKTLSDNLIEVGNLNYLNSMSFLTWYFDKNRPLPPGSAFDPYRQKDFERRKAEGFPAPLYPSSIPTPEATPEQQEERDKYWKEFVRMEDGKEFHYIEHMTEENRKEYESRKKREGLDVYGNIRVITKDS